MSVGNHTEKDRRLFATCMDLRRAYDWADRKG